MENCFVLFFAKYEAVLNQNGSKILLKLLEMSKDDSVSRLKDTLSCHAMSFPAVKYFHWLACSLSTALFSVN